MRLFPPVCTAVGHHLAKALQPLLNSGMRELYPIHVLTCACLHKEPSRGFSCCLSAEKDFSPCICTLALTAPSDTALQHLRDKQGSC